MGCCVCVWKGCIQGWLWDEGEGWRKEEGGKEKERRKEGRKGLSLPLSLFPPLLSFPLPPFLSTALPSPVSHSSAGPYILHTHTHTTPLLPPSSPQMGVCSACTHKGSSGEMEGQGSKGGTYSSSGERREAIQQGIRDSTREHRERGATRDQRGDIQRDR